MEIAINILAQLGGNKFRVMTGAKNFLGGEDHLQFSLPRGFASKGINKVKVTLLPSDTYKVEFLKFVPKTLDVKTIAAYEGVYCDDLQRIFTKETGLDTHL